MQEIGLRRIDANGDVKWSTDTDVIEDIEDIEPSADGRLKPTCMDQPGSILISLDTGLKSSEAP